MSGIQVTSLTKAFGDHKAVRSIDFSVDEGEVVALLGPSGCGKTTTLRCLAGLEEPTEGRIDIAGTAVFDSARGINVPSERRGVGLVFQSYALWPHMTVEQNVQYGLRVQRKGRPEIARRTAEILGAVGLSGFEHRYPASLSGGQQQRVALARSLVMEPRVLLFDEPLSNLDSKLRESMRHDLRKLIMRIGLTAVYVTHDQSEAMVLADEIILMNDGRIEQMGSPAEMYRSPRSQFAADFIGSANFLDATVAGGDVGRVRLRVGPEQELWAARGAVSHDVGDAVKVAIRPEALRLSQDLTQEGIKGTVLKAVYLGSHLEYIVECVLGELFAIDHDMESPVPQGSTVSIRLARREIGRAHV
jgi:iron(III) transport system ATP-binding protein